MGPTYSNKECSLLIKNLSLRWHPMGESVCYLYFVLFFLLNVLALLQRWGRHPNAQHTKDKHLDVEITGRPVKAKGALAPQTTTRARGAMPACPTLSAHRRPPEGSCLLHSVGGILNAAPALMGPPLSITWPFRTQGVRPSSV